MKSTDAILSLLKRLGPLNVKSLAEHLAMTTMGARQHLHSLEEQGLIENFERKVKVGRPTRYWQLSEAGHRGFPDSHSELSVQLIGAVREVFGETGLDKLIRQREQHSWQSYSQALASCEDLPSQLSALSARRSEEGYMASWHRDDQGRYWFIEDHCPICSAANACQNLCRSELQLLQALFDDCEVARSEHLLGGARRCAYQIIPR